MLGVRLLRITAWSSLGFGTTWWPLLMFLVAAYGATGARWLFLGGIGAMSAWSELDETVFGGRELGWIVIVIGFAGAILVAIDRTAAGRVAPD